MNPTPAELGFIHRFIPGQDPDHPLTLLLLHGTGGDESDLLPLGRALAPTAAMLSPRGKVLENGMPRFFRRLAEGVFDLDDLMLRTHELADFVERASTVYRFDPRRVVAAGYSNGANIAAGLLLLRPELLAGAILFRAMVPLVPKERPNLAGISVFISAGLDDPLIPAQKAKRLVALLRETSGDVTIHWQAGGHALQAEDVDAAREWLATRFLRKAAVQGDS